MKCATVAISKLFHQLNTLRMAWRDPENAVPGGMLCSCILILETAVYVNKWIGKSKLRSSRKQPAATTMGASGSVRICGGMVHGGYFYFPP